MGVRATRLRACVFIAFTLCKTTTSQLRPIRGGAGGETPGRHPGLHGFLIMTPWTTRVPDKLSFIIRNPCSPGCRPVSFHKSADVSQQ
jgi:hypothetical protein